MNMSFPRLVQSEAFLMAFDQENERKKENLICIGSLCGTFALNNGNLSVYLISIYLKQGDINVQASH